ncbi:MAG: glycosyltransferase family 39 protein [Candidatus Helarchaeota archaeon]
MSLLFFGSLIGFFANCSYKDSWRGGDYLQNYGTSLLFTTQKEWFVSSGRPPFFNIINAFFLIIFKKDFFVYQLVSEFLSIIFILPLFNIVKRLFDKRNAFLTMFFSLIIPITLDNLMYPWSKQLTNFFILCVIYELLIKTRKNWLRIMSFTAFSFLSHTYSLFYITPLFLYFIINEKNLKFVFKKKFFLSFGLFFIFVSPWVYHIIKYKSRVDSSKFLYYPFAVNVDYAYINDSSKKIIIKEFFNTSLIEILRIRFLNFYFTVTPFSLIHKYIPQIWPIKLTGNLVHNTLEERFLFYTRDTFFGALGFIFCLLSYLGFWHSREKQLCKIKVIILLPLFFYCFFIGFYLRGSVGLIGDALYPSVYLLIPFGVKELLSHYNRRTLNLVYFLTICNSMMFFILNLWVSKTSNLHNLFVVVKPFNYFFALLTLLLYFCLFMCFQKNSYLKNY